MSALLKRLGELTMRILLVLLFGLFVMAGCQSGEESAGDGNGTAVTTNANQVSFDIPGMT